MASPETTPTSDPAWKLGVYPTPVHRLDALSGELAELWVKNDGRVHPEYGGNKVRKLELVLPRAVERGARRLVTMGAAGSHHVLATVLFGKKLGLPTAAVLCPQPHTEHAEETLIATLALGCDAHPVSSMARTALGVARILRPGDYVLPPGGSSVTGTLGYLRAVGELADQIRGGVLPEPDLIVAPLGSGGTVAGLLAGVLREGLASRVIGVEVAVQPQLGRTLALALATLATRRDAGSAGPLRLHRRLEVDGSQLGRGYGHPTADGSHATAVARHHGLELDPTYTAKTFAKVLDLVQPAGAAHPARRSGPGGRPLRVLYWHTLSSVSLGPLLAGAPRPPPELAALLTRGFP
jgi:D-cysteine desulfhydrase